MEPEKRKVYLLYSLAMSSTICFPRSSSLLLFPAHREDAATAADAGTTHHSRPDPQQSPLS